MRRPPPLPPPATGPRPAAPPTGTDEGAARVIPFATTPGRGDAVEPGPDMHEDLSHADRELGLRDVWRASRARRRALRAEVRRFTVRQRRRRMLWLGVAIALALLVIGTVGAAYSPLLAVRRIEVVGTTQLDPAAVTQALEGQLGTPLPLVDDSVIKAALVRFPLVESYTLEARPPSDLVVRIVERTPVGVVESAAGFTVVDAAGVALSTTPTPPPGQPVLTVAGGRNSDAFRAVGQVVRSLPPEIRAQVTAASATTPDDVTLTLGATETTVVWGNADQSGMKAITLQKAMIADPPERGSSYDVSTPAAIVVR